MISQAVLPNNTVIGYTYDAQGRLIAKRVNGVVTKRWLYDGQLRPVAELAADGDVERYYLYALHANIPEAVIESDGTVYRIITDHLGSPRMVVNTVTGEIVKELAFDEFGNITSETGTYSIPFGFAGGIRDTDTGLTRFGARWYDSETGRWTSKEPLGFEGSNNFYSYVNGDPVNYVDVTGLKPGDMFDTPEDAARDAAEYVYYNVSDSHRVEYLAEIFQNVINSKYTYLNDYIYSGKGFSEEGYYNKVYLRDGWQEGRSNIFEKQKLKFVGFWHNHVAHEKYGTVKKK